MLWKKKTAVSLLLIVALLFSLSTFATADSSRFKEETSLGSKLNPYAYRTAPDDLYVFLYHGTAPLLTIEIDTTECVVGRLYVYNGVEGTVTEVCDQVVEAYTVTQDALYFITQTQKLYKSDYSSANLKLLYTCDQGSLTSLSSYLNILYFIENDNQVVFFDVATEQSQQVICLENLSWVYLLSETELIAKTAEEEYYLCDLVAKGTTEISDFQANAKITEAVLRWKETGKPNLSLREVFDNTSLLQINDILLPLAEYPATIYDNDYIENFNHPRPISWFHKNGQEGCLAGGANCKWYGGTCECEGFARYAHDVYYHMVDNTIEYDEWLAEKHPAGEYYFDGQTDNARILFSVLEPGAYVRYKTEDYYHSIVFVGCDNEGAWVYECNQLYVPKEEANHPELGYLGCGVHFQYYTYERIALNYPYVYHYVNHSFLEGGIYENATYHKVECIACNAYLRQEHTPSGFPISEDSTYHKYTCAGCGEVVRKRHNMIRLVNGRYECRDCGYTTSFSGGIIQSIQPTCIEKSCRIISSF